MINIRFLFRTIIFRCGCTAGRSVALPGLFPASVNVNDTLVAGTPGSDLGKLVLTMVVLYNSRTEGKIGLFYFLIGACTT